jgi:hypothetical protein
MQNIDFEKVVNEHYTGCFGLNPLLSEVLNDLYKIYPYRKYNTDNKGVFRTYAEDVILINGDDCLHYKPRLYENYVGTDEKGEHYENEDPFKNNQTYNSCKAKTYSKDVLRSVKKRLEEDVKAGSTKFKFSDLRDYVNEKTFHEIRADLELPYESYVVKNKCFSTDKSF